ncbi:hypothetical protein ACNHUS_23235 [Actinomycetes bacterium M1A6_2h]
MANAVLASEANFTLCLTYGQFYINAGTDGTADWDELVQHAIGDGHFAADEANIVASCPVSYNPALLVRVEMWTTEPEHDPDPWEVSIRHAVSVGHRGRVHLITVDGTTEHSFPLNPSTYQFEVLGHAEFGSRVESRCTRGPLEAASVAGPHVDR